MVKGEQNKNKMNEQITNDSNKTVQNQSGGLPALTPGAASPGVITPMDTGESQTRALPGIHSTSGIIEQDRDQARVGISATELPPFVPQPVRQALLAIDAETDRIKAAIAVCLERFEKQRNINFEVQNAVSDKITKATDGIIREIGSLKTFYSTRLQVPVPITPSRKRGRPDAQETHRKRLKSTDAGNQEQVRTKSPAERTEKNPPRQAQPNEWQKVNKKRRKATTRPRFDAILVKPEAGKTYKEALESLKKGVDPAASQVQIESFRSTKEGAILVRVLKGAGNKEAFKTALTTAIGGDGSVRDLTSKAKLEILDLDPTVTASDIISAMTSDFGVTPSGVHVFNPNKRQECMAVVEVEDSAATTILRKGRLKVGWINCRIRSRVVVPRCYRCLGYGHYRRECKGLDRKDSCRKCGKIGHAGKACPAQSDCFLCAEAKIAETGHLPGTGRCTVFRNALNAWKNRSKHG